MSRFPLCFSTLTAVSLQIWLLYLSITNTALVSLEDTWESCSFTVPNQLLHSLTWSVFICGHWGSQREGIDWSTMPSVAGEKDEKCFLLNGLVLSRWGWLLISQRLLCFPVSLLSLLQSVTSCQPAPIFFMWSSLLTAVRAFVSRGLPGSQLPGYSLLPVMSSNCQFILSQPFHHSAETGRLKPPERPEDSYLQVIS